MKPDLYQPFGEHQDQKGGDQTKYQGCQIFVSLAGEDRKRPFFHFVGAGALLVGVLALSAIAGIDIYLFIIHVNASMIPVQPGSIDVI